MIVNRMDGQTESRQRLTAATTSAPGRTSLLATLALPLLGLGLVAGCGTTRPSKYYQLTVPAGLAPPSAQTLPVTIIVNLPAAPDLYRDTRLVYAVADQQLGAYQYERWAAPPPEMIQDVFLRSLRSSGRYMGVYTPQAKANGDYALRMRIYDFKEQDASDSIVARLTMDVELQSLKTGEPVWQHYYAYSEPVAAKTVPDVVAGLNKTVQSAANDVTAAMDQYFTAHPPK